jgi:hypothetical protein
MGGSRYNVILRANENVQLVLNFIIQTFFFEGLGLQLQGLGLQLEGLGLQLEGLGLQL